MSFAAVNDPIHAGPPTADPALASMPEESRKPKYKSYKYVVHD